ncbi:MAG: hypothetical protein JXB07_00675 [Anaerolineae bacterium]|nr:hypothetical protein [Anaerolineae bacterium]
MPFQIGWLDEKLHIYNIVLSDPFDQADQGLFFETFFQFMDAAPSQLYGLFDISRWSQSGAAILGTPQFMKMGGYRNQIVVIVMVTQSTVAAAMGKLGAVAVGDRDWMRFEESQETAVQYLKERATAELKTKD